MAVDETTRPTDLLLSVRREPGRTLGSQVEEGLRAAIREGALRPGTRLPSTRDLAKQAGISRRVVVDSYAQLAAEGFLSVSRGARAQVRAAPAGRLRQATPARPQRPPRFDFQTEHARRVVVPASGVAAIPARGSLGHQRRGSRLRGPARGDRAALRSGVLPRSGPRRRRRSRPSGRDEWLHPESRAGVSRARDDGREPRCARGPRQPRGRDGGRPLRPRAGARRRGRRRHPAG